MSKRWLGLLPVFVGIVSLCSPGVAHAAFSATNITVGTVNVGASGTANGTLSANPAVNVTLALGTGCTEFEIVTPTAAVTVGPGGGNDVTVTVKLTPTSVGAKTCTITATNVDTAAVEATFTATGTGVAPTITVSPQSPPTVSLGSVRVDNAAVTTATRTFTLGNGGTAGSTLTITSITLGPDYAFNPDPTFPITIAAGSTQNVTVEFNPSAAGTRDATMTIASDDPATPSKTVALTGTGTTAIIAVADANFGIVANGSTSTKDVVITNTASASRGTLTVTSATITGGGGFFSFGNTQGCTGGTTCTFTQPFSVTSGTLAVPVRCSPPAAAAGTQLATVDVISDTDPSTTTSAQLSCTAGRANILVSTNTLAFGDVPVNTTSAAKTVTIMNTGNATLTYSLTKTPNLSQFAFSGCSVDCALTAGSSTTVDVTLRPTAIGPISTQIDITSNDPDPGDGVFSIAASGNGTAPQINLDKTGPLAFGDVEVGATSGAQTLTATNTGNAPLSITSAAFQAGGTDYTVVASSADTNIPAGGTLSWDIKCKPTTHGARPGTFRIVSNSLTTATIDVALTCTGRQGVIATVPTLLDFGAVTQGTTKQLTFTLRNTGNLAINNLTGVLDKLTIGYAFDAGTLPTSLAAGETSSPITVTFAPKSGDDGGPAAITFTAKWGASMSTTTAVLQLQGDGLTAGYDVTPATINFGDFRFDSRPTRTYKIINNGQSPVAILTHTFTPAGATATTEFAFTIKKGAATVALPQTLAQAEELEVTVTAQPNDRTGLVSGQVDIHSDLKMLPPDRKVTLTGNAISAGVSAPMMTDFGAVDIDGAPVTKILELKNTGVATLDITSVALGANPSPAFQVTLPSGLTQVAPGQVMSLTVTYTPTVERPANQLDTAVLVAQLKGIAGGPSQSMMSLQGRGIDRHLSVAAVEDFPQTFKNPGDAAPVRPIKVTNTGEAPLRITAVMVTGDPVWQLVDAGPVEIAGGASHDFRVRFSPTIIGAAPTGQLTLVNDDNARPMAQVTLNGNGIGRNVAFGPAAIDLGYTGVGIPLTAANILAVTNMDPSVAFKIHAIELTGDAMFRIDDAPADLELPAANAKSFAITFEPTAAGDFETKAILYLDQDHEQQAEVTITGHALFVDAHGSGGCNAGRSGGGGGLVVLLAALGVAWRRRRAGLAVAAATVAMAPAARADGLDLAVFEPTPATTGTSLQLQAPDVGPDGSWVASAVMSYASNPLVLDAHDADGKLMFRDSLIQRSSQLRIGGAYAFLGRFEAGAHIPLFTQSGQAPGDPRMSLALQPASGTARGNLTLHAKAQLWRGEGGFGSLVAGASAMLVVPTATKGQFTGSDELEGRLLLLGSFTPSALASRLALSFNAGPVVRGKTTYANIAQQSGVGWGVGASVRILDPLWATAEVFGEATPSGKRPQATAGAMGPTQLLSPVEWLVGVSLKVDRRFTLGLGGGRGMTSALGTPDARGVLSLAFVPGADPIRPIHPPEPVKPDGDGDGDGVRDSVDKCPSELEDKDLFEDGDGCPELDNDRDGVADQLDQCALDPEDKDGFQDADGCPDQDNDGDGILDTQDRCANAAEDKDGFDDLDGCAELDNDRDGLPDAKDQCPGQPETINGNQDDDGCPDKGDPAVMLSPDRVELLDPLQFAGNKLTRASLSLLGQVAATMRAHPEIVRLRVTVHVQPTSDPDADLAKSTKRAQMIREWLVQWGIAPARVEARGFGGDKPLVPASRANAAKINERVELIILERS